MSTGVVARLRSSDERVSPACRRPGGSCGASRCGSRTLDLGGESPPDTNVAETFAAAVGDAGPVGAIARRLGSFDGRVALAQRSPRGEPALEHPLGLDAEEPGLPQHDVGEAARLERPDVVRDPVRDRGLDRHLREVAQDARRVVAVVGVGEAGVGREARDAVRGRAGATPSSTWASWNVRRSVSPIRPIPWESRVDDAIAPSSCSGPSAAIVRLAHALGDQRHVVRDRPRQRRG